MKFILSILFATVFFGSTLTDTPTKTFPSVTIKTLDGKSVNIKDYVGQGKITVVSFWATWCSPCKRELDALATLYPEWQEKYDVEIVAVTIDNARALAKVPGIVASKDWEFTILSDAKQELQRSLNFQAIPQVFLLDANGNIIYSHSGYNPGDEFELEEKIEKNFKK